MIYPDDPPVPSKLVQTLRQLARPIYRGDVMETELGKRILPVLEAAGRWDEFHLCPCEFCEALREALAEFLGGK